MSANILANPDATFVEADVKTALKPGTIVNYGTGGDAGVLVGAAANAGGLLMVLDMSPMNGGGIDTDYTAGDTARAERLVSGKTYNARSAAAAYAAGDAVQVGANNALSAHSGSNPVAGYVAVAKTTTSSDPFLTFYAA